MRTAAMLVLAALALTACESSQEENAKLERLAKQEAKHRAPAQSGLSVTKLSTKLEVLATAVVSNSEGAAAVVTVRNRSAAALRNAPIAITVKDAAGASVYTNNTPGLAPALTSVPLVPAHGELTWVDDQVPAGSDLTSLAARVGEGEVTSAAPPRLAVAGVELSGAGGSEPEAEGHVVSSGAPQREVVVYGVARRGRKVVAAGSALVPEVATGQGTRFQLYFIGSPSGAKLQFSAVAAAA